MKDYLVQKDPMVIPKKVFLFVCLLVPIGCQIYLLGLDIRPPLKTKEVEEEVEQHHQQQRHRNSQDRTTNDDYEDNRNHERHDPTKVVQQPKPLLLQSENPPSKPHDERNETTNDQQLLPLQQGEERKGMHKDKGEDRMVNAAAADDNNIVNNTSNLQQQQQQRPQRQPVIVRHKKVEASSATSFGESSNHTNTIPPPPTTTTTTYSLNSTLPEEEEKEVEEMVVIEEETTLASATTKTTTTNDSSLKQNKHLVLNVPFYVYDDELPFWKNGFVVKIYEAQTKTITKKTKLYKLQEMKNHPSIQYNITALSLQDYMIQLSHGRYDLKHNDDWYFVKSAMHHPMRVTDPSKAQLFVVPALLNLQTTMIFYHERKELKNYYPSLCLTIPASTTTTTNASSSNITATTTSQQEDKKKRSQRQICDGDLLQHVDETLESSIWYQRSNGKDHITVASAPYTHYYLHNYTNIINCNMIGFEGLNWNHPQRTMIPSLYVGTSCPSPLRSNNNNNNNNNQQIDGRPNGHHETTSTTSTTTTSKILHQKKYDFAMIASMSNHFYDRNRLCRWFTEHATLNFTSTRSYNVSICGTGSQCPALQQSKFGFHIKGDTFGSNRLMDTILSGTVPIFSRRKQYEILPDWYNWTRMSYFADILDKRKFLSKLDQILANEELYQEKLHHVLLNRDLFDWNTLVPFDTYMYMFYQQIYPNETRTAATITTPYTALLLNPPSICNHKPQPKYEQCDYAGTASSCDDCYTTYPKHFHCDDHKGSCHYCQHGSIIVMEEVDHPTNSITRRNNNRAVMTNDIDGGDGVVKKLGPNCVPRYAQCWIPPAST